MPSKKGAVKGEKKAKKEEKPAPAVEKMDTNAAPAKAKKPRKPKAAKKDGAKPAAKPAPQPVAKKEKVVVAKKEKVAAPKLFVKNLPTNFTKVELARMLEKEFTGSVNIEVAGSKAQVKSYASVEFKSSGEVDAALKNKQGVKLGGKSLFLKGIGKPTPSRPTWTTSKPDDAVLYVRNLPKGHSEDELRNLLKERFANPKEMWVATSEGGGPRGFAFIQFSNPAGVNTALKLQGSDLRGNALFLDRGGVKPNVGGKRGR